MSKVDKLIQQVLKPQALLKENKGFKEGDKIKAKEPLYIFHTEDIEEYVLYSKKEADKLFGEYIKKGDVFEYVGDNEWEGKNVQTMLDDDMIKKYFTKI